MGLDVEVPDPPSLRGPQTRGAYEAIAGPDEDEEVDDDYRREELATVLDEGAWADAFEEWAAYTDLTDAEFEAAVRRDVIDGFDFYWDPGTDEVGYRAPDLPEEVRAAVGEDAETIETELDALGRVVSEVLENDYLRRDDETFGLFADEEPGAGSGDGE
ncbi:MAG: hypothetical protein ABEJ81_07600 [Haloferacaceae archaeon]